MPDTYTFTGKDGVARSFVGDRPPSASEMAALEQAEAPTSAMPRPAGWQPAGSYDTSDGPAASPSTLAAMLGPLAHPQTLDDFGHLLGVPVDTVRSALVRALAMTTAAKGVTAAKQLASRVRVDPGAALEGFSLTKPQGVLKGLSLAPKTPEMTTPGYDRYLPSNSGYAAEAAPAIAETPSQAAPAAVDEFTAARTARAAEIPPPVGKVVPASGKMQLTAPEFKEFTRMVNKGIPHEDALTAVRQMRQLARQLGGATDAEVAAAIKHRGTTGSW